MALETSVDLEGSAYQVRHLKFKEENLGAFIESIVAKKETGKAYSILGKDISCEHYEELDKLHAHASLVMRELKKFHTGYTSGLHYHQTLFSILYRLIENLQAIKLLIANGYY